MKRVGSFLISLIFVIGLAFIRPDWGAEDGLLRSETTTQWGVFIIFMLQGLLLPVDSLKRGLVQWRLHLFCQVTIFVIIPIVFFMMTLIAGPALSSDLKVGFLYLAILPTTLSTAVVFTSLAQGNVAGALFNAATSNVVGIFLVPLWVALIVAQVGQPQPMLPLLIKMVGLLFLPLCLGQLLRPLIKTWIAQNKNYFAPINTFIVYFIIYAAFCNAVKNKVWETQSVSVVLMTFALTGAMLLLVTLIVCGGIRLLKFERSDAIAAFFCASQKTLAAGVPIAQSIFGNTAAFEVSLVILPLMFYHPLQIALGGVLIGKYRSSR